MTPLQFWILAALALLGLAMLATIGLIGAGWVKYRNQRQQAQSLLKRLENNPMLPGATPPTRRVFWSRK